MPFLEKLAVIAATRSFYSHRRHSRAQNARESLTHDSLADTVFEFKGFLINAIEWYRAVTEPVIEWFLAHLSWKLYREQLDIIIIGALYLGVIVRSFIVGKEKKFRDGWGSSLMEKLFQMVMALKHLKWVSLVLTTTQAMNRTIFPLAVLGMGCARLYKQKEILNYNQLSRRYFL